MGSNHKLRDRWKEPEFRARMAERNKSTPPEERMHRFVELTETDECILWTGAKTIAGYGLIGSGIRGKNSLATHVSLRMAGKPKPFDGAFALHHCDNPSCVNPRHLFWGAHEDNMADQKAKGRHWATRALNCAAGHDWTSENTRIGKDGRKNCRTCEALRVVKKREARRAARISGK